LDEAITRILAVKAAIGLHRKQKERDLVPLSENLSILIDKAFKHGIICPWLTDDFS
jgi:hypothetical protein